MAGRAFLHNFLTPLARFLERPDVTDIYINCPGEVWLESANGTERHVVGELDDAALWRLARQVAAASDQGISREHPLLAATLPDGARIQICAPPATRGNVAIAIRKHSMPDLRLSDYVALGALSHVGAHAAKRCSEDRALCALLDQGRTGDFLSAAVKARKTILISGGTGTGKTTFLNALLKEAPAGERLVLIEDTPEIVLGQPNAVGLVAARGRLGEACVTVSDLVEAALRLRPDRIIMGELRGAEAFHWLRAVGTGHPGSITTIHAASTAGAVAQLALMALMAESELRRGELIDYIHNTVDVFIQLERHQGTRLVSEIIFDPPEIGRSEAGALIRFDRLRA